MRDGILDNRRGIEIIGMHAIGDIAVHKQLARLAMAHGRLRDSAVGASNPQNLRRLAFAQLEEGIRIFFGGLAGINAVTLDDAIESV